MRVLLVDDDPVARRGLRRMLTELGGADVVAEGADAGSALDAIHRVNPDVVLLDIEMPEHDGFEVATALAGSLRPYVIFVTAHDRYAIEAFRSRALDYVLKPVRPERLAEALSRARERLGDHQLVRWAHGVQSAVTASGTGGKTTYQSEFVVRIGLRDVLVPVGDVIWIEADSYYVRLHTASREYLTRRPLRELTDALDPSLFVQVHRSAIVNVNCVREIRRAGPREHTLTLVSGASVPVSRARWRQFSSLLRRRSNGPGFDRAPR